MNSWDCVLRIGHSFSAPGSALASPEEDFFPFGHDVMAASSKLDVIWCTARGLCLLGFLLQVNENGEVVAEDTFWLERSPAVQSEDDCFAIRRASLAGPSATRRPAVDRRSQASATPDAHAPTAAALRRPPPPHHPGPGRAGAERLSRGRAANKVAARAQRGDGVRRARPGGGEVSEGSRGERSRPSGGTRAAEAACVRLEA